MIYDEIPSHCDDVSHSIQYWCRLVYKWAISLVTFEFAFHAIMQTDSKRFTWQSFRVESKYPFWIFWLMFYLYYLNCELSLFTFHKNEWRNQFIEYVTDSYDCLIIIIIVLTSVKNVRIYFETTQHFDNCIRLCLAQWSKMPVEIRRQQQSVRLVLHKRDHYTLHRS